MGITDNVLFIMQTACSPVQPGIQGQTVSVNRHTSGQHWAAAESGSMLMTGSESANMLMSGAFMRQSMLVCLWVLCSWGGVC